MIQHPRHDTMMRQGLVEEAHTLFSKLRASFWGFFICFIRVVFVWSPCFYKLGMEELLLSKVDLKNACLLSSSTMPPSSRRHFEQRAANKACRRREAQQRGGNPHKTVTIQLFNGLPLVKYQSSHISHFCPSYISIYLYILASPHCQ